MKAVPVGKMESGPFKRSPCVRCRHGVKPDYTRKRGNLDTIICIRCMLPMRMEDDDAGTAGSNQTDS